MSTNWNDLRPRRNSQNFAFEELCCQLAEYEAPPPGAKFIRKGTPDGGVECFWMLPNGGEWGWQAKYLFPPFTAGKWAQLDKSVHDAIENHPNLIRYTICLPFDRPDPHAHDDQKSFLDRWNERVSSWGKYAIARSRSVEFVYWGDHELYTRLTTEQHAGRHKFWFDREFLSQAWFDDHLREVVANSGDRYTPVVNVELPIAQVFDGLGRTPKLFSAIDSIHKNVRKALGFVSSRRLREMFPSQIQALQQRLSTLFSELAEMRNHGWDLLPFSDLATIQIKTAQQFVDFLSQKESAQKKVVISQAEPAGAETPELDLRSEIFQLHRLLDPLYALSRFSSGSCALAANKPAVLMVGEAGSGKTHLLCDVAEHRIKLGQPTVVLLGQQFQDAEPWKQILDLLKLDCKTEELLGALDASAQATGARALILIDALNEGEGQRLWNKHLAGMLARLENYPRIGIAVTVRSSYEKLIIPRHVESKLVRIEHHGFEEHEYEATNRFFTHFGIEPSVPLLYPEFKNPQFLLLFCKGLKNKGLTRIPTGLHGITAIFDFFLDSVNEKLARPENLNFDPADKKVQRATEIVTQMMAQEEARWLSRDRIKDTIEALHPSQGYDRSLFQHLVSEGILAEDLVYSPTSTESETAVRFSYERLADHRIAKLMLETNLDKAHPEDSFTSGKPLARLFGDNAAWRNQGVIEALCVQIPEQLATELPHLLAKSEPNADVIRQAFVKSLLWRSSAAFNDSTIAYINDEILRYRNTAREFWNTVITLAPVPGHPFNADRLHRHLMKPSMPDRDAWWSIFLQREYGRESAVDRILDWVWSPLRRKELDTEAAILCATAIGWFLTSSNRFLRDHATKTLTRLVGTRADVLLAIIERFRSVDDLYVTERILAVAYGCATKIEDPTMLERLATTVYNWIFAEGKPFRHILARDYARGVIESALRVGADLKFDISKARPPYKSVWPRTIASKAELEAKYGWREDKMPEAEWSRMAIYNSVMGFGDFARYVIGTNSGSFDWSGTRLGKRPRATAREKHDKFLSGLKGKKKEAWEQVEKLRWQETIAHLTKRLETTSEETDGSNVSEASTNGELDTAQKTFEATLTRAELGRFRRDVLSYLAKPRDDEHRFDLLIAQRWILQRVFDLGWTTERFGTFDRDISSHRWTRDAKKSERIGKKYQWIAYHELLGLVADNFEFGDSLFSDSPRKYEGPWQTFERDIDPTCALREIPGGEKNDDAWWCPQAYEWGIETESEWISSVEDLPLAERLIEARNPGDGSDWLTLESYPEWREPVPGFEEDYENPRRHLWYQIRSILVQRQIAEEAFTWLSEQHFWGRWMPENPEHHGAFLGEFYWAPAFDRHEPIYVPDQDGRSMRMPYPFIFTAGSYSAEMNSFDCSVKDRFNVFVPGAWLVRKMNLRWKGMEGRFFDAKGELVAFDPATRWAGPNATLVRKEPFLQFLSNQKYDVIWFVLGGKQILGGLWGKDEWAGELQLSGVFKMSGDKVQGTLRPRFISPDNPSR